MTADPLPVQRTGRCPAVVWALPDDQSVPEDATVVAGGAAAEFGCRRDREPRGATCAEHAPDPDLPGPFLGISYRQLDYWTRIGLLIPLDPTPGSGVARSWPDREVVVALTIRRLLDAGLELRVAGRVAREQVTDPTGAVRLRGGLVLDLAATG